MKSVQSISVAVMESRHMAKTAYSQMSSLLVDIINVSILPAIYCVWPPIFALSLLDLLDLAFPLNAKF